MSVIIDVIQTIWLESGFAMMDIKSLIMIGISLVLLYFGIVKQFEPLLLVGIAFGALLTNLPGANLYHPELWDAFIAGEIGYGTIMHDGGLLDILYIGVKAGVYPSLIFMGIGAMTDLALCCPTPRACCWALLHSWAYSWPILVLSAWASPVIRLLLSASSVVLTAPLPSS